MQSPSPTQTPSAGIQPPEGARPPQHGAPPPHDAPELRDPSLVGGHADPATTSVEGTVPLPVEDFGQTPAVQYAYKLFNHIAARFVAAAESPLSVTLTDTETTALKDLPAAA